MKTIIMRTEKSSRWAAMLLATVVAVITSVVVANATQTITTPNAAYITYSLAAGTNSAAITPAASRTVLVMGCCTTAIGAGQVSLVRNPGSQIAWAGYEAIGPTSTVSPTGGIDSFSGTHILYLDNSHKVDIQTASADTILIHNGQIAARAGSVTLIW
jgi:hypothetical protein